MKKTFKFLFAVILATALFAQCKNTSNGIKPGWEELYAVLSEIPDGSTFGQLMECEDCEKKDAEYTLILTAKDSLEASLISLRFLADEAQKETDCSDSKNFTKKIIRLNSLGNSVKAASTVAMIHFTYLQALTTKQTTDPYESTKKALLSTDLEFSEMGNELVALLTDYNKNQESFNACLKRIYSDVTDKDLVSASKELESDEYYSYLLSCAKMLKALYEFESSRATAVQETVKMSK